MSEQKNLQTLLKGFAQFLGEQSKAVKSDLVQQIATAKSEAVGDAGTSADAKVAAAKSEILEQVQSSVAALKSELLGGAAEELDTFKELADELNRLKSSGSEAPEALLSKLTELRQEVDALKSNSAAVDLQQLKDAFNSSVA